MQLVNWNTCVWRWPSSVFWLPCWFMQVSVRFFENWKLIEKYEEGDIFNHNSHEFWHFVKHCVPWSSKKYVKMRAVHYNIITLGRKKKQTPMNNSISSLHSHASRHQKVNDLALHLPKQNFDYVVKTSEKFEFIFSISVRYWKSRLSENFNFCLFLPRSDWVISYLRFLKNELIGWYFIGVR